MCKRLPKSLVLASAVLISQPGCPPCVESRDVQFEVGAAPSQSLRAVALLNGDPTIRAVAVGDQGVIVLGTSAGDEFNWIKEASGTTENLRAVATIGFDAVAVGENGTILYSGNYAQDWTHADSGVTADLYGVAVGDVSFAVGDEVLLRSLDLGKTWEESVLPGTPGILRAVRIGEGGSVLAVGDGGIALMSRNNGSSWDVVELGTELNLRSIGYGPFNGEPFTGTFLVAGEAGLLRQMEDEAGAVWSQHDLATSAEVAVSPNGDWAVANGAFHWLAVDDGPFQPEEAQGLDVRAIDGDSLEGYAVGAGGLAISFIPSRPQCHPIR